MTVRHGSDSGTGLFLHTGNRLEILADRLSQMLQTPLRSPLTAETIVVQSRGMQRWISMEIARRQGIFANAVFPFPNTFVYELCRTVAPSLPEPEENLFHPSVMTFRLFGLLPECIGKEGFAPLRAYLRDDVGKLKQLQLAEKIADLFDQYLVFRPDLIFRWEDGRDGHWQARLWRMLASEANRAGGGPALHRARLWQLLVEALEDNARPLPGLPERVTVFGISYLPPFHLAVLAALSKRIPVHLFCVNPCREYWADIAGRRDTRRIARRYRGQEADPESDLHLEEGNRLLAATGTLGKAFLDQIVDCGAEIEALFEAPGQDRLLFCIQSDVLTLRNPKAAAAGFVPDGSIQVHACHSPMREVEVLHDHLLALFEGDSGLDPRDVLVMTPDIETYAPLIHAVFDAQPDDRCKIPYSVADSSVRRESRVADGLLAVFDLAGSRTGASEVLNLLEIEPVRMRFGLSEEALGQVARWVAESGIRWGRDAGDRQRFGLPAFSENTWRAGIDRMLLGYAVAGEEAMVDGIVPFGHIEGGDAQILGRFLEYTHRLFALLDRLSEERPPASWRDVLAEALEALFHRSEENEAEHRELLACLETLARHGERAGCTEPIGWQAVSSWLRRRLENRSFGSGFMAGGVTFCAMVPMRSIPFSVVCMLGLNVGVFPREGRPPGFDLMAASPRPGDRNRRDDDKYLFLEALISARRMLYISYVGQSVQDNTPLPPSVLVSELLDAVSRGYGIEPERIVVQHRLQAFSPRYFEPAGRLFSYSVEDFGAAEALGGEKQPFPFFSATIPMTPEEQSAWRTLDVKTLCEFFAHPVRFLLRRRLEIFLEEDIRAIEDHEPFVLDGLQSWQIGQDLVKQALAGASPASQMALARGRGRLPAGTPGEVGFRALGAEARRFAEKVRSLRLGPELPALEIDLSLAGYSLRARLDGRYAMGMCRFRYGRMRPVDLLDGWIRHLALCAGSSSETEQRTTSLYFRDGAWRFAPVADARRRLASLLGLFEEGLCRPLHFFAVSSEAYARARAGGADEAGAMKRANRAWSDEFRRSESDDPYLRLCFRDQSPLDESFCSLSEAVWLPLFDSGAWLAW